MNSSGVFQKEIDMHFREIISEHVVFSATRLATCLEKVLLTQFITLIVKIFLPIKITHESYQNYMKQFSQLE